MSNEGPRAERHDPGATMSGDPERELELRLKKDPSNKQAQVDLGSDESMDASDPSSACQPGGNDPAPSNDFPETDDTPAGTRTATRAQVVQAPTEEKPYKVVIEHEDGRTTEEQVATMAEGEAIIREASPTPPPRDRLHDHPASRA